MFTGVCLRGEVMLTQIWLLCGYIVLGKTMKHAPSVKDTDDKGRDAGFRLASVHESDPSTPKDTRTSTIFTLRCRQGIPY
jgi:hypothetical protein